MNDKIQFNKYNKRETGYHLNQIERSLAKEGSFIVIRYGDIKVLNLVGDSRLKRISCGDIALINYLLYQRIGKEII